MTVITITAEHDRTYVLGSRPGEQPSCYVWQLQRHAALAEAAKSSEDD